MQDSKKKETQKMTVSNVDQLGAYSLMKNPSIVKDMHLKYAHSRYWAGKH